MRRWASSTTILYLESRLCGSKVLLDQFLVKLSGFALVDCDGILGTVSQAGAKTIAEFISDDFRLAVHYLQSAFRTMRNALTTAIALLFVDVYHVTYCHLCVYRSVGLLSLELC